jgi:hypothetical protein
VIAIVEKKIIVIAYQASVVLQTALANNAGMMVAMEVVGVAVKDMSVKVESV